MFEIDFDSGLFVPELTEIDQKHCYISSFKIVLKISKRLSILEVSKLGLVEYYMFN
jgi:hypothetical protein